MKRSNLKVLKRIQMLTVSEDGTSGRAPQTIYIDSKSPVHFVIRLPTHVVAALACEPEVRHTLAAQVVPAYEKIMRQYLDWYRTAKAEPVIVLHAELLSQDRSGSPNQRGDIDENAFFHHDEDREAEHKATISLTYSLLFRVNGEIHWRTKDRETGEFKVGHRMAYVKGIVLDYTPELHARLDRICNALHDAAHLLHKIIKAKDVGAALLASANLRLPSLPPAHGGLTECDMHEDETL
jgi:hypothetical protein